MPFAKTKAWPRMSGTTRVGGGAGLGRRRVLPAKSGAGEALEPRLQLRVVRRRVELEVEMRPGRVAGLADEPDRLARAQHRSLDDLRIEVREVAVRPFLSVAC